MAKRMLIDATHPEETRVVILSGSRLEEFDFETSTKKQVKGNIYLAKVTRVEPSLQAAFVEYGGNRHGFLAFSEIHPDYYQIPVADREALMRAEEEDDEDENEQPERAASRVSRRDSVTEPASEGAADDAVERILDGQTDALDHARVAVAMRTWTADDLERARHDPAAVAQELGIERSKLRSLLDGGLDTPLAACVDFDHSPVSGGGRCTASFLLCLACPNAVATPEHLVRIVCLHDSLEALGSALDPKVWNLDYADHFARIRQLLATKTTPAQQEAARSQVSFEDRERIEAMLARRFDA